ncbi:MAG: ABC transporter permease [Solirubrobacteraceae bacterium]|nr:ABC transporter permease [Solirubrobacteraceae bacterium]
MKDMMIAAGEWVEFSGRALAGLRRIGPYGGEVLRQAALITAGSALIIVSITAMTGATCGLQATVMSRSIGAGVIAPMFSAVCSVREVVPVLFGVILAGKVGCGMVAEIGAMRVAEEIDALEVMGVPSMVYLISTRLAAGAIAIPPIYLAAVASAQAGAWFASYVRFHDISQGSWEQAFYGALRPIDLVFSLIKGVVTFLLVLLVALYFGNRVRGGPVEVGEAVARSMFVNLGLIAFINPLLSLLLWGFDPPIPIA